MKKIIAKWLLIPLTAGLIFSALIGATRGGIVLIPVLLMMCLVIGFIGACIHVNIYAYKFGYKQTKIKAAVFTVLAVSVSFLAIYSTSICNLTEEYALNRVHSYFQHDETFNPRYLSEVTFQKDRCECKVAYLNPQNTITFIITAGGDLHLSRPIEAMN